MEKIRVVHYVNQFFAGIGGEEKADIKPHVAEKLPPISAQLNKLLGDDIEIVGTVVCGDSYFGENMEAASQEVLEMVKGFNPQLFIAGPAFNAGRYGVAAGTITKFVKDELNIPALTGMYVENPGADMFKKDLYIVETADSAAGMRKALPKIASLAKKLVNNETIGSPAEEGYIQRGIRVNYFAEERGSKRAVNMLIKKIKGEAFVTEYPMPNFDRVDPQPAIKDLSKAKIALVTSGGIVPKGNPDRIESSSASKYGEYNIDGVMDLTEETYETAHGGFDPVYCNLDSDRVLPVDVLRDLEAEGAIGSLHEFFYSTTGNGTAVASSKKFAEEFAQKLIAAGVDAVILTSTWGTCTRCGATMVKEIERAGLPVVHICTVVPISLTVGANRIVPAIAIPHPLGNPKLDAAEEKALRRKIVEKSLVALATEVEGQTVFEKDVVLKDIMVNA